MGPLVVVGKKYNKPRKVMCVPIHILVFVVGITAEEYDEEQLALLPKLYYLDDYDDCLSSQNGLYCLGIFKLMPTTQPSPAWDIIKGYSEEVTRFNRTLIHRGYCVSKRCPPDNSTFEHNHTQRFENCENLWSEQPTFIASLHKLHYCRTHAETLAPRSIDTAHIIYLVVLCIILLVNVIGSIYDFIKKNSLKKNKVLMTWSVQSNWNQLMEPESNTQRTVFASLQGIRVNVAISICMGHAALIHYILYLYNPQFLEKAAYKPETMFLQNSTSIVQMFVTLSTFLCSYHLLFSSEKRSLRFSMLPKIILKRIFRLSPVYLLVVGFAATWWPWIGDGPLWSPLIDTESQVCREKFWPHALFVNNLVDAQKTCLLPTWFIAVDVQMYIIAAFLTVALSKMRRGALAILTVLLVASCGLNAALAYVFNFKPMLFFNRMPEHIRILFSDVPSFTYLYISPWGNLPACFLGLILGYLCFMLKDGNLKLLKNKWLQYPAYIVAIPILLGWFMLGYFVIYIESPVFLALYAAFERSIFQIIFLAAFVVLNLMSSLLMQFFAWQGWHAMGRMSLSVVTLHWCINKSIVATAQQPIATSALHIAIDGIATAFFTYLLAIPVTLLVEMPMKKVFDTLVS